MALREISAKELIRPIEDPSRDYPFNPRPINNSDSSKISRFSYKHQNPSLYGISSDKMSYSDRDYHKKKRKSFGYEGAKPFSGSYEGSEGSSYAFSGSKFTSGNYKMAA